jgi:copper chaperone NosL
MGQRDVVSRRTALRWLAWAPVAAWVGLGSAAAQGTPGATPRAVQRADDRCPACGMAVMDARFAAQAVTDGGRVLMYDAVECLADHHNGHAGPVPTITVAWLADRHDSAADGAVWRLAEDATVLFHPRLRTPMGGGLVAFETTEAAWAFAQASNLADPTLLSWAEVLAQGVDRPWVRAR